MRILMTETYSDWKNNLRDLVVRARVQARTTRLAMGNPGQHRVLGGGVCELKLDFGGGLPVLHPARQDADRVAGGRRQIEPECGY